MITYEALKEKLAEEGEQYTKFFTKEFWETYLEEKQKSFENFVSCGEYLKLTKSEASDFYVKNGYAWCRMLEFIYESLPKWRIDFIEGEYPTYSTVERRYEYFETKEQALLWAKAYRPTPFHEILKVG